MKRSNASPIRLANGLSINGKQGSFIGTRVLHRDYCDVQLVAYEQEGAVK